MRLGHWFDSLEQAVPSDCHDYVSHRSKKRAQLCDAVSFLHRSRLSQVHTFMVASGARIYDTLGIVAGVNPVALI